MTPQTNPWAKFLSSCRSKGFSHITPHTSLDSKCLWIPWTVLPCSVNIFTPKCGLIYTIILGDNLLIQYLGFTISWLPSHVQLPSFPLYFNHTVSWKIFKWFKLKGKHKEVWLPHIYHILFKTHIPDGWLFFY